MGEYQSSLSTFSNLQTLLWRATMMSDWLIGKQMLSILFSKKSQFQTVGEMWTEFQLDLHNTSFVYGIYYYIIFTVQVDGLKTDSITHSLQRRVFFTIYTFVIKDLERRNLG